MKKIFSVGVKWSPLDFFSLILFVFVQWSLIQYIKADRNYHSLWAKIHIWAKILSAEKCCLKGGCSQKLSKHVRLMPLVQHKRVHQLKTHCMKKTQNKTRTVQWRLLVKSDWAVGVTKNYFQNLISKSNILYSERGPFHKFND